MARQTHSRRVRKPETILTYLRYKVNVLRSIGRLNQVPGLAEHATNAAGEALELLRELRAALRKQGKERG